MESRTTELQTVQKNYPVLPSGVTGLLIPTMSSEEIMGSCPCQPQLAVTEFAIAISGISLGSP